MSAAEGSVFARLKDESAAEWAAYVGHDFVRQLAAGSLPEACFRHYLVQDYLFLVHFSRAYALAVYKAGTLEDMRSAASTLDALLNTEMGLHVRSCAAWGLSEAEMAAVPEAGANLAYTRFVLDTGMAGDFLDLLAALAPCVLGYGEIGARLLSDPATKLDGNPYREWIETYGGADYQEAAAAAGAQLERVARDRLGADPLRSPRWDSVSRTFRTATRLEAGFWAMGLTPPAPADRR